MSRIQAEVPTKVATKPDGPERNKVQTGAPDQSLPDTKN